MKLREVLEYPVIKQKGYMLLSCLHVIPIPNNTIYGPNTDGSKEKRMCRQCK